MGPDVGDGGLGGVPGAQAKLLRWLGLAGGRRSTAGTAAQGARRGGVERGGALGLVRLRQGEDGVQGWREGQIKAGRDLGVSAKVGNRRGYGRGSRGDKRGPLPGAGEGEKTGPTSGPRWSAANRVARAERGWLTVGSRRR